MFTIKCSRGLEGVMSQTGPALTSNCISCNYSISVLLKFLAMSLCLSRMKHVASLTAGVSPLPWLSLGWSSQPWEVLCRFFPSSAANSVGNVLAVSLFFSAPFCWFTSVIKEKRGFLLGLAGWETPRAAKVWQGELSFLFNVHHARRLW